MGQQQRGKGKQFEELVAIATQFIPSGHVSAIHPLGNGNINDTYLVQVEGEGVPSESQFVLQRINTQVFTQPRLVMNNMHTFCEHVHQRLAQSPLRDNRRWETPRVLLTQEQGNYWDDLEGNVWRGISFIANATTFDTIQSTHHAEEIGYGLGMFHTLISDLPAEQLADTLEGFHITPRYVEQFEAVEVRAGEKISPELSHCLDFVHARKAWASVLENAKAEGKLPLRLMHGDPKINNILFDQDTQQAISLIDLDTVKPGLVHYDIGDCLRSGCNPLGEETHQWESVSFDVDLCRSILSGYLSVAHAFLTEYDYHYLYDAIRLIAFELGVRFLTDYLAGDVYFKTHYPEHNLMRALVQFQLTASIEGQEAEIEKLVRAAKMAALQEGYSKRR